MDLVNVPVTLTFGDQVIVQQAGGHGSGDPLKPAVDLVNELRSGAGVRAGQVMTTGTYSGLHFATPGQRVRAAFAGFGAAEVDVTG
jgi:2-keto-4-pentenoate hydratase